MSKILFVCILFGLAVLNFGSPVLNSKAATPCDSTTCLLPSCRCSGTGIPGGLTREQTPQFVMLTFDDAVTISNIEYYQNATFGKRNHDGCPVAPTYYVSHEYTNYELLHRLYAEGHEIATHSITHISDVNYWKNADVELMIDEFVGARTIYSHFGNIPESDIQGIRLPFLQMNGDISFQMLNENNFNYDASWPTQSFIEPGMWPYTLEHTSSQDCPIGPCPIESWPSTWVMPMIMWRDRSNVVCAMVDTCVDIPHDDVDELVEFMMENFRRTYNSNRAPMGFYVHAAWFLTNPIHFQAYEKFIDELLLLDDVYLVGASTVLDWVKNPVPLDEMATTNWSNCRMPQDVDCNAQVCTVNKGEEVRYMTSCAACPHVYPWLGNPMGEDITSN